MAHIPTADVSTPDLSSHVDPSSRRMSSHSMSGNDLAKRKSSEFSPHFPQSQRDPQDIAEHHAISSPKEILSGTPSDEQSPKVPGALPHDTSTPSSLKKSKKSKRDSMNVSEEMKTAIGSLGQYAKGYLPTSVGSYIGKSKRDQMPTTEKPTGSQMGVGSLPGDINESSVAKLPDERSTCEQGFNSKLPSKEQPSGSRIGIGSLPGNLSEPAVAALPEEKAGKRFNALTVPDTGPMSRANRQPHLSADHTNHSGGVGSLPGTPNETGVARLPEERKHASEIYPIDSHALQSSLLQAAHNTPSHQGGVGDLPGTPNEVDVVRLPEERQHASQVHSIDSHAPQTTGSHIHSDGVGDLPGTPHEYDVVRLPEERQHGAEVHSVDSHAPQSTTSHVHSDGVGDLPGKPKESGVARLPEERQHGSEIHSLDSHAPQSTGSYHIPTNGVGDLPGTPNESGVVRLPEERQHASEICSVDSHAPQSLVSHAHLHYGGVGDLPGGPNESGIAQLPEERHHFAAAYPIDSHAPQSAISPAQKQVPEHHSTSARHPKHSSQESRPSGYVNEPSASGLRFSDSGVPPSRSYSNVQQNTTKSQSYANVADPSVTTHTATQSRDISSGFGSLKPPPGLSLATDEKRAKAFPSMTEPPITVYQKPVEGEASSSTAVPTAMTSDQTNEGKHKKGSKCDHGSRDSHAPNGGDAVKEEVTKQAGEKSKSFFPKRWSGFFHRRGSQKNKGTKSDATSTIHDHVQEEMEQEELPTQEVPSGSNVGVGSLPGETEEAGVAALPDESAQDEVSPGGVSASKDVAETREPANIQQTPSEMKRRGSSRRRKTSTAKSESNHAASTSADSKRARSLDGKQHEQSAPRLLRQHSHPRPKRVPAHFNETIGPLPDHVEMRGRKELPSHERPGGSRVGVGSLPGRRGEKGVARLPDERKMTRAKSTSASQTASPSAVPPVAPLHSADAATLSREYHVTVTDQNLSSSRGPNMPPAPNIALGMFHPGQEAPYQPYHQPGYIQAGMPLYQVPPGNSYEYPGMGCQQPTMAYPPPGLGYQHPGEPHLGYQQQPQPFHPSVNYQHSQQLRHPSVKSEHYTPALEVPNGLEARKMKTLQQEGTEIQSTEEGNGLFNLKRAQREQEQRKIEIETGQRQTIFNAGAGNRREHPEGTPKSSAGNPENVPGTSNSGGELQQRQGQFFTSEIGKGSNAPQVTRTPSKLHADAPPFEFKGPLLAKTPSTSSTNARALGDDASSQSTSASSSGQYQGTEKGLEDAVTTPNTGPAVIDNANQLPSSGQGGLLSTIENRAANLFHIADQAIHDAGGVARGYEKQTAEILHGAEEAMQDAGDVARGYVPKVVGDFIPHHGPSATQESQVSTQTQGSSGFAVPTPVTTDESPDTRHPSGEDSEHRESAVPVPSTEERINGKKVEVIQPLKEEYVHSITEDDTATGDRKEGPLPGYPGAGGISALVGERMYDDHLRASGVAPIQMTTNTSKNESYLELRSDVTGGGEATSASSTTRPRIDLSQGNISKTDSTISNRADHGSVQSDLTSGINTPFNDLDNVPTSDFSANPTSVGFNRLPSETSIDMEKNKSGQERESGSGEMGQGIDVRGLGPPIKEHNHHGKEKQSASHARAHIHKSTRTPKRSHN